MTAPAKYSVLLVEDDEIAQMAFRRLIRDENLPYDYSIAGSIAQANSVLKSRNFDIVIIDYMLPDGTGLDLLSSITAIPVIFTTGAGSEELAVKAMKAGAYDYLIKDPGRSYLTVLPQLVKHAIEHMHDQEQLRQYHGKLEDLVEERTMQLKEEQELLSVTFKSMADGVIVTDTSKRIILLNPVAANLIGLSGVGVIGCLIDDVFQLVDEHTRKAVKNPVESVLTSMDTNAKTNHAVMVARNGAEHLVAITAAPIRNNDESTTGIVVMLHDLAQEREIDRMKTDFISSISHELRTPLTSIKAYTATILHDTNMPEQTKQRFLSIILDESDRLTSIVNQLLEISQLDNGPVKIVRQPVDIKDISTRAIIALKPLAQAKNIRLEAEIADTLPMFSGDKDKLQSVITNLVNNAIKFTPPNGQVQLLVEPGDHELLIRVSDTGIGISSEDLPKLFGRFYRIRKAGDQTPGTGLGLAIVKEIVVMHGGRVSVETERGHGTTFTVVLPLAVAAEAYSNSWAFMAL
jgi:PAS domain S-box-containing protein